MLYLYAVKPHVHQALKDNHCLKNVVSLLKSSSVDIQLLLKGLLARLIPVDTTNDEIAQLLLINDDEVHYLIHVLQSCQSQYTALPIVPLLTDLCRSSHNMHKLASMNVASLLSNIMDSIADIDQSEAAQLIWSMMTLHYEESVTASAVINSGTLQSQCLSGEGKLCSISSALRWQSCMHRNGVVMVIVTLTRVCNLHSISVDSIFPK